ncbi:MAG: hypothetical protein L0215_05255 [Gemmataceae bacterium]|nr:hypothetical protein [Gemmataceae bacterium]
MSTLRRSLPAGYLLAVAIAFSFVPSAVAQPPPDNSAEPPLAEPVRNKRRVFVLHSGVHTILSDPWKNIAAEGIKSGLEKRGVSAKDLIVLDNPFPSASWRKVLPYSSLTMFMELLDPASSFSHESYRRLHKVLEASQVSRDDDVIWIGHSAGGQMGLTMANLGRNLWRYPDLAKETSAYRFEMVVTLGSPICADLLPPEVKLRHYYSPEDKVVRWAARVSPYVLYPLGYRGRLTKLPLHVAENCKIRFFLEVEHPHWDIETRVLDRIMAEANGGHRPLWHSQLGCCRLGLSLSQALSHALEEHLQFSLEDPPQ